MDVTRGNEGDAGLFQRTLLITVLYFHHFRAFFWGLILTPTRRALGARARLSLLSLPSSPVSLSPASPRRTGDREQAPPTSSFFLLICESCPEHAFGRVATPAVL